MSEHGPWVDVVLKVRNSPTISVMEPTPEAPRPPGVIGPDPGRVNSAIYKTTREYLSNIIPHCGLFPNPGGAGLRFFHNLREEKAIGLHGAARE